MQKLNAEKQTRKLRASNVIIWVLVTFVIVLSIGRIVMANQLVGLSEKLHLLDKQIAEVGSQNQIMSENLRVKESLTLNEQKIASMGFSESNNFSYLRKETPVAFRAEATNL